MKNFLAIFTCAENSKAHQAWIKLTPEEQNDRMQKGMIAMADWYTKYKSEIVYEGSPLGDKTKAVDLEGVHDLPSQMGNFFVIKAKSHEEAADMFLEHPHFAIFPGNGVEILEFSEPRGQ